MKIRYLAVLPLFSLMVACGGGSTPESETPANAAAASESAPASTEAAPASTEAAPAGGEAAPAEGAAGGEKPAEAAPAEGAK